jgi:hypothetical protein
MAPKYVRKILESCTERKNPRKGFLYEKGELFAVLLLFVQDSWYLRGTFVTYIFFSAEFLTVDLPETYLAQKYPNYAGIRYARVTGFFHRLFLTERTNLDFC